MVTLFPAHAGVILRPEYAVCKLDAVPRTRGGDPLKLLLLPL